MCINSDWLLALWWSASGTNFCSLPPMVLPAQALCSMEVFVELFDVDLLKILDRMLEVFHWSRQSRNTGGSTGTQQQKIPMATSREENRNGPQAPWIGSNISDSTQKSIIQAMRMMEQIVALRRVSQAGLLEEGEG
jgi:hypothetical protein